jgi:hypothetical protein
MAGLHNWDAQDTLQKGEREHDWNARDMMNEGNIRTWERLTNRLVLFAPATLVHGKGSHCHVSFFSQVLFVFYYVSLVLHSPVAL